jgi:hypothetical protein
LKNQNNINQDLCGDIQIINMNKEVMITSSKKQ